MLIILVLSGCTSNTLEVNEHMITFVEQMDQEHKQLQERMLPKEDQAYAALHVDSYMNAMSYMLSHIVKTSGREVVTPEMAIEDTNMLFTLLEDVYCGYTRNNEATFAIAKQAILDYVNEQEEVYRLTLAETIREQLRFLNDAHIKIDYQGLQPMKKTYYEIGTTYQTPMFYECDGKYYRVGYTAALKTIHDDSNLPAYLKPILNLDGSISYQLYMRSNEILSDVQLSFDDGECITIALIADRQQYEDEDVKTAISYAHPRKMMYPKIGKDEKKQTDKFLKQADEFKESNIAILDLRGNTGGNAILSYEWILHYTGSKRNGIGQRFLRMPLEDERFIQLMNENADQSIQDLTYVANLLKLENEGYLLQQDDNRIIQDTILFVLQDGGTASAAEMLIDQLHTVDHVIFVGTPTLGALHGSTMMSIYLEHTGMQVSFGNLCTIYPDAYANEYEGIQPDIWISSQDALTYVLSFIKDGE